MKYYIVGQSPTATRVFAAITPAGITMCSSQSLATSWDKRSGLGNTLVKVQCRYPQFVFMVVEL
jgi:hypothetical protein